MKGSRRRIQPERYSSLEWWQKILCSRRSRTGHVWAAFKTQEQKRKKYKGTPREGSQIKYPKYQCNLHFIPSSPILTTTKKEKQRLWAPAASLNINSSIKAVEKLRLAAAEQFAFANKHDLPDGSGSGWEPAACQSLFVWLQLQDRWFSPQTSWCLISLQITTSHRTVC